MLVLGHKKEPQRIVLRAAVPSAPAVRKGKTIVTPATDGEPEAFVVMAPITPAMRRRAQRASRRQLGEVADFADLDIDRLYDAGETATREIVRLGMIEWGGFGDAAGNPLELTPDRETRFATANDPKRAEGTIDLLLAEDEIVERIEAVYVAPDALRRAEKNASFASQNGTGGAAKPGKTTAGSRAARKAKPSAARNARTSSTRSKPKRAKRPGKS